MEEAGVLALIVLAMGGSERLGVHASPRSRTPRLLECSLCLPAELSWGPVR